MWLISLLRRHLADSKSSHYVTFMFDSHCTCVLFDKKCFRPGLINVLFPPAMLIIVMDFAWWTHFHYSFSVDLYISLTITWIRCSNGINVEDWIRKTEIFVAGLVYLCNMRKRLIWSGLNLAQYFQPKELELSSVVVSKGCLG